MANLGDAAQSNGDIMRRLRELEGLVRELAAGRRLENATVGAGGLRIKGAGGIRLQDGGGLTVEDGGQVHVIEGGDVIVEGGGDVRVLDDGTIVIQNGGVRVEAGGVIRSENFDGNMTTSDPGNDGWALGNERLALDGQFVTPVEFAQVYTERDNFAITTTPVKLITETINVPSWGPDEALIQAIAVGQGANASGASDYIGVDLEIDGLGGPLLWGRAENNELAYAGSAYSRLVDVAGRTSFEVSALAKTFIGTFATSGDNFINLNVIVVFRRAS